MTHRPRPGQNASLRANEPGSTAETSSGECRRRKGLIWGNCRRNGITGSPAAPIPFPAATGKGSNRPETAVQAMVGVGREADIPSRRSHMRVTCSRQLVEPRRSR